MITEVRPQHAAEIERLHAISVEIASDKCLGVEHPERPEDSLSVHALMRRHSEQVAERSRLTLPRSATQSTRRHP